MRRLRFGWQGLGFLAVALGIFTFEASAQVSSVDPDRFAIVADLHTPADRTRELRTVKPAETVRKAVEQIDALRPKPAGVIAVGDTVFLKGEPGDYDTLRALTEPFRASKLAFFLVPGNHDSRENMAALFPASTVGGQSPVAGKRVTIVESPKGNWILLDSLDQTNVTPGRLGKEQLEWLAAQLDARSDKPAILVLHHNLELVAGKTKVSGLLDTADFLAVVVPRRQVKAIVFGHTHRWQIAAEQGIHLINIPTTAWPFDPKMPQGWVDARLKADGMSLTLRALDSAHAMQGETRELKWR